MRVLINSLFFDTIFLITDINIDHKNLINEITQFILYKDIQIRKMVILANSSIEITTYS